MLLFWFEEIKLDQKFWIKTILKHVGYVLSEQKIDELCEALTFRWDYPTTKKYKINDTILVFLPDNYCWNFKGSFLVFCSQIKSI